MKKTFLTIKVIFIVFVFIANIYAKEYKELPTDLKAALLLRILELNKTICESTPHVCIHVINDPLMYNALQKILGAKFNDKEITKITQSEDDILPSYKPSVIYIGQTKNISKIIDFTQNNKILSVTGSPNLIDSGVTISIVMLFESPNILLKGTSSKNENMKWDLKMTKIATLI